MLEPWIIDKIRRREDERMRERNERRLELPLYEEHAGEDVVLPEEIEEPQRGVVVIDL